MQAGLVSRTRRETAARLGNDAGLIACAAILGLGLGGLLHRVLIAAFEHRDRLTVLPNAPHASLREDLLTIGPLAAIALSVAVFALMRRGRSRAWSWRRAAGVSIAVAGAVVLVVGELEVHVFRTLAQGWRPHDLFWDVIFHLPGEAIALSGWLILPRSETGR